eukprot:CAMPEP_0170609034 /NCGR_PEP_ID=MMETSP0224-20130122/21905_1 /TAXON_ID=285029 /ORGANISM="Togula jolla, Strain CCCM 725" /LENGTH=191 /DNA_ID=CAMNT_0010934305 /DNA_START=160 /DNA_END=735 /DNA_ORIENTATION=+
MSFHYCKCGSCIKRKREALLDPANAGVTAKSLIHQGKYGHESSAMSTRSEKMRNGPSSGRAQRKTDALLEAQECVSDSSEDEVPRRAQSASASGAASSVRGDLTLGDFMHAPRRGRSQASGLKNRRGKEAKTLDSELIAVDAPEAPWPLLTEVSDALNVPDAPKVPGTKSTSCSKKEGAPPDSVSKDWVLL